jgi:hypothetical protein
MSLLRSFGNDGVKTYRYTAPLALKQPAAVRFAVDSMNRCIPRSDFGEMEAQTFPALAERRYKSDFFSQTGLRAEQVPTKHNPDI